MKSSFLHDRSVAAFAVALLAGVIALPATTSVALENARVFDKEIRPLLNDYCLSCHSTEKQKGDLDLERFTAFDLVLKDTKVWQNMVEQLSNNEMPPKDKPQPSAVQRQRLISWANAVLDQIALARAGDPGPVVLRRLNNAEYTYTIRDLTGVNSLDPAREFPGDSAAGEGFMNTGQSLVMSPPLLTKYLDAAKSIAAHAVLLPDGIRFSAHTSRRDWTEEILNEIRAFYRQFADPRGGDKVNLQGIVFETNEGGRLPLEKYLSATIEMRQHLGASGAGADAAHVIAALARLADERGLSRKYLQLLWAALNDSNPSLVLDPIRARWRASDPSNLSALVNDISQWQKALWKFSSVGHIGKLGGPKAWMEPINPLASQHELRLRIAPPDSGNEVTLYLWTGDAGDGNENDWVVWQRPRLVMPGQPDLLLRDVRALVDALTRQRERIFASTTESLAAAAEASEAHGAFNADELASKHGVEPSVLRAWLDYLGLGPARPVNVEGHFTNQITSLAGYEFIKGWGASGTPNLVANSSDQAVRIPGNMKPHSVAVHPSPKLHVGVGWLSPMAGSIRIEARVTHAHPECGNGVVWSLETRRGTTRQKLAGGAAQGSRTGQAAETILAQPGDLVSLLVGSRDGNHSCDLTAVDFVLTSTADTNRTWNLASDVSGNILQSNPQPDRFGHASVWHFYTEPERSPGDYRPAIPGDSLLTRWQAARHGQERVQLAQALQQLLTSATPPSTNTPDGKLYAQLASFGGPLLAQARREFQNLPRDGTNPGDSTRMPGSASWSIDPALFGRGPDGAPIEPGDLCVRAPSVVEVRLPADLVAGAEFVATGRLHEPGEGSAQLKVLTSRPEQESGLLPSAVSVTNANGPWTSVNTRTSHGTPILVSDASPARQRILLAFGQFRQLFPAALCYTKIVPVDEVVTLTLFYREDHYLSRLMLDDAQAARLDRLWSELHFVSQDALALVDAFEQLWQYATQDADPKVFEPLRQPIQDRAAAFRQLLVDSESRHVERLVDFAGRAFRRPLTQQEQQELRELYRTLRLQEIPHDDAIRLTLARVLVSPAFLYRTEKAAPGIEPAPVTDWELATRLSYFLWSSLPDAELRALADSQRLRDPEVLAAQVRRMLRDPKIRRLSVEFACQWLHIHGLDTLDEKSERHFPMFASLRDDLYEESIQFFTDLFQRDGAVLEILDADHTFLNEELAQYYGIPGVSGPGFQRVDGIKKFARGGILAQASTLAKQSGASRTSPILRGNWIAEALLGDKLPRPPKDVPQLPDDEAALEGLTVRQLTEKHSSDPRCSGCHVRIDPFGYALEGFDAIGRRRDRDLAGRPIDTRATVLDGSRFQDLDGLRSYLLEKRQNDFLRQFCRKLLGYALGRSVLISDRPLLAEMQAQLSANQYRVSVAIDRIVRSEQFRKIRGREMASDD